MIFDEIVSWDDIKHMITIIFLQGQHSLVFIPTSIVSKLLYFFNACITIYVKISLSKL